MPPGMQLPSLRPRFHGILQAWAENECPLRSLLQGYGFGALESMLSHLLAFTGAFMCPLTIYAWQSELHYIGDENHIPYWVVRPPTPNGSGSRGPSPAMPAQPGRPGHLPGAQQICCLCRQASAHSRERDCT